MKIAIVHPSLRVKGGAENVVVWLADELARRGHDVTVFTAEYDEEFYGAVAGQRFAVVIRDLGGYTMNPQSFLLAGWRLRRELAGFDWVNPHNFPAYIWTVIARLLNPHIGPIVWFCEEPVRWFYPEVCNPHMLRLGRTPQSVLPRPRDRQWRSIVGAWVRVLAWKTSRIIDRWAVPRLDLILTNSAFIATQVRTIFGVRAWSCLLGVPPARFEAKEVRGPAARGRYILTVSRLFPEKNVDTVLEAVAILHRRGMLPFDRYIVVGEGPLREELQHRAAQLGIDRVVEFRGFVSEEELATLYRQATLVIYLPLDETFGLVFAEAALYEKPVIGPSHGGPVEIIQHGVTGWQVDATNPTAVAERLASSLRDPAVLRQTGEAGHRFVSAELTFSRFADRFEAWLQKEDALRSRRRRGAAPAMPRRLPASSRTSGLSVGRRP